jgi:uncharacterized phiE125 gp8 family phage protein
VTYSVVRITEPGDYPITLAEVKKQLEIATAVTYHDEHLLRLIAAATQYATERTGRQLIKCSYRLSIDDFPPDVNRIALPYPPLVSVTSVKYLDADGVQQTLAASLYRVLADREPGEICLKLDEEWPDTSGEFSAVEITYVAGKAETADELTAADELLRQGVLVLAQAYWLRDHGQSYDDTLRAADLIFEGCRCGDDFLDYWQV